MKGKKYFRVLYVYDQMKAGKVIVTTDAINMFDVDRRTIQRDLNEIRCYLADRKVLDGTVTDTVVYDKNKGGYVLKEVA